MTREEIIVAYAKAVHDENVRYFPETVLMAEKVIKGLEAIGLLDFNKSPGDIEFEKVLEDRPDANIARKALKLNNCLMLRDLNKFYRIETNSYNVPYEALIKMFRNVGCMGAFED